MGGSKGGGGSQTTDSAQTQTRQPTAEETQMNQLDLQLKQATQDQTIQVQKTGLTLANTLLSGGDASGDNLPGWMKGMTGGIDAATTQSLVNSSMNDVNSNMAGRGLLDSGTAAAVGARASSDIRTQSAEFNIGNKLNMLNLALTGQAQVQQPSLGYSSSLGSRLSNLAGTTSTGSTTRYAGTGGLTW